MPEDFLARRERMAQEGALVFRKVDYFQIFVLLMLKQHRRLARYYVNLDPAAPLGEDEVVALIRRRVAALRAGPAGGAHRSRLSGVPTRPVIAPMGGRSQPGTAGVEAAVTLADVSVAGPGRRPPEMSVHWNDVEPIGKLHNAAAHSRSRP